MTSFLLKTKLHIPPGRSTLVPRPRLIQKLDQGLTHPLTLISAPPGFGKTTLLTAWLEQKSAPTAWLSLDERDNDLARFLAYLIAALETVQAGVGRQSLNRLHSRRTPSIESVMTLLSNDLAAVPHDFILVLDDYHLIELQVIHEAMAFLLDHLPPSMHLVIATRADPPLPIARLRARDQLVELRAPDLRFSPDEAAAFLNTRMGLNLTTEQIAALDTRAEGWIAGLQLAALSMQGHDDLAGFVRAFTGSNRFVLDYLAEEVWQRQPPEIQSYLLQTSILDQMNAALSDAVTGRNDSATVLSQLERANLFVVPLDDVREWYRYHHLFADLLHSRLMQSRPEEVAELHRKAGTWYEQNGFVNEAIDHALAVPDFNRAATLIEQAAPALLVRSEDRTLRTWLAALPDGLIQMRPSLGVWQAVALAGVGDLQSMETLLARMDDAQLDPLARGIAVILRATVALFRSDLPHAIESARNGLTAAGAATAASTDPQAELGRLTAAFLAILLAEAEIAAGQLRAALATFRQKLDFGESVAFANFKTVFVGYVHVRLAELFYEWNEIDTASQHATQGMEISHAERNEEFESYALIALAQIKQAQGDPAAAIGLSERALALARGRNVPVEIRFIAPRHISILIQQGRLEEAASVAQHMPAGDQATWFMRGTQTPVANARVMIARSEFGQAVQALEQVQIEVQASGEIKTLIEILALLALARSEQGDTAQAEAALVRALSLAEPEGYVRTFVDMGEPMRFMISDFRSKIRTNQADQPLV
jgi:LuxR family transcriptional regulator, maltose regulon positive regulatory protein